jgi:DNA-directed RNA polymerase sigma subunit (sigma70/sigma32)
VKPRLTGRHLEVIAMRERDKMTFRQIGEALYLSANRARQIYLRAKVLSA